jgi:hypothetical protein
MKNGFALGVVIAIAVSLPAAAQVQYGTIAGSVVDAEGRALPGVKVTLAGPAMQGVRTTVTDALGRYLFIPVPRGSDYTVAFESPGVSRLERPDVAVNVGKQTAVLAAMGQGRYAETVVVSAAGIVVDTTQSALATTVEWELLDQGTTSRHYSTIWYMDPGVPDTAQGNPSVRGAGGDDNIVLIDGVDTTDPAMQTWGTQINWDTIEEAQVETGGHPAEFGRAPGGVMNLVTKSGGNEFHFTARVVLQDSDWDADPGFDEERGITKPAQAETTELRPNFTLGGPVVKDRLWFYVANEWRDRERANSAYDSYDDVLSGTLSEYTVPYEGHEGSAKLTWQVNPSHSLVAYYNEDPIELSNLRGVYTAPSAAFSQFQGGKNWSLQWYGMLSQSLFVEGKAQLVRLDVDDRPQGEGFGEEPSFVDRNTGFRWGVYDANYESSRDRDGALLSATYFLDAGTTSHRLKAGVEWLEQQVTDGTVYNPAGIYRTRGTVPNSRYLYLDQVPGVTIEDDYWALFVQDKWQIGRLALNLGLRAESFTSKNNLGVTQVQFGFSDQIAPRLGFAYDFGGGSLHGSASRYYDLPTNAVSGLMSNTPARQQYWTWTGKCSPSGDWWESPDSCWTLRWDVPIRSGGWEVDAGLKPIALDELTLGWEHRLTASLAAGANLIWRRQKRSIDNIDPEYDGVFLWTNSPVARVVVEDGRVFETDHPWKEFQGLELTVAKRLGPDGLQFIASYSYVLKNQGWVGTGGTTSGSPLSQFTLYGDQPDAFDPLWYGNMQSPHWLRLRGSWTAPWRMTIGVGFGWNTGRLYTRTEPGQYGNVPLEEYGSSEVGNNWEGDLHIEQLVRVGPLDLGLYVDVLNAFNNQQPVARGGNVAVPAEYALPTAWQLPRSFVLGFKLAY